MRKRCCHPLEPPMAEHYARTLRLTFKKDIPDDLRQFLSLEAHPWDESFVQAYNFARQWFDPEDAIQRLEVWFQHSSFVKAWKGARYQDGQLLVLSAGESTGLDEFAQWIQAFMPWLELEDEQVVFRSIWECHRYEDVLYYNERSDSIKRGLGQRFNWECDDVKHAGPWHPNRYEPPLEGARCLDDKLWWNYETIHRLPYKSAATATLRTN